MSQSQKGCGTVIALIISEGVINLSSFPSVQRCTKEGRNFIGRVWKRVAWGRVESVFSSMTVGGIELADEVSLNCLCVRWVSKLPLHLVEIQSAYLERSDSI